MSLSSTKQRKQNNNYCVYVWKTNKMIVSLSLKAPYVVSYTAVFRLVTQRSSPQTLTPYGERKKI